MRQGLTLSRRSRLALGAATLCSSGAAALGFEILWFRQATYAFGSSVWSSACVMAACMVGMGLGSLLCARICARVQPRTALRTYGLAELSVGAAGLGVVYALPALAGLFAPFAVAHEDQVFLVAAARFAGAFALLAAPSAALGATLPLAVRGLRASFAPAGVALGLLYAVNTLGAAAGVVLVEYVALERLGVRGSALLMALLSLCAASGGALLAARSESIATEVPAVQVELAPRRRERSWLLLAASLMGFAMLGLEVVWLRFLMLFLTDTPRAFAAVLTLVLLGVASGSAVAARCQQSNPGLARHVDLLAYAAGGCITLSLLAFPRVISALFRFDPSPALVSSLAAALLLPAALASGAAFALLGARLSESVAADERSGLLLASNTFGCALGSALAALWVLPALGVERGLVLLMLVLGAAGLLLSLARRPVAVHSWGGLAAFCSALALFPFGAMTGTFIPGSVSRWMGAEDRIVAVREGVHATFVHVHHRSHGRTVFDQLATNAYSMSANDFAARRYMSLFAVLPLALHPGMERALVVGFGLGTTVEALSTAGELSRIDIVELSPEVLQLSRGVARFDGRHPLDDERVHVHIEDARHHLAGTELRYDLITGEPPPPVVAGVENIYSREYFELIRARLAEGGYASYWLPLINISAASACSVVSAFCAAFEDCSLWDASGPNFMLLGRRAGARAPVSLARYVAQWTHPERKAALAAVGLEHPVQLGPLFVGDAAFLARSCGATPPLSDDRPLDLHRPGAPAARAQLARSWHDTGAARERFMTSELVAERFPREVRRDAPALFDGQRLFGDLLAGSQAARSPEVLDQLLHRTPWQIPVLLLLGSDPDVQLAGLAEHDGQTTLVHRLAAQLTLRDFGAALETAQRMPAHALPVPGLREYLERSARGEALRLGALQRN